MKVLSSGPVTPEKRPPSPISRQARYGIGDLRRAPLVSFCVWTASSVTRTSPVHSRGSRNTWGHCGAVRKDRQTNGYKLVTNENGRPNDLWDLPLSLNNGEPWRLEPPTR